MTVNQFDLRWDTWYIYYVNKNKSAAMNMVGNVQRLHNC